VVSSPFFPVARLALLSFVLSSLAACQGPNYDDCVYVEDPSGSAGARRDRCAPSQFVLTTTQWRDVNGQARRGENGVSAIVQVEPASDYASEKNGASTTVASDQAGFFGPLHHVSLRYNISFREGLDVIFYGSMAGRSVQPSFDDLPNTPRFAHAYVAPVVLTVDPPLPADQTLTLFTSSPGDKAYDIFGTYETGLSIAGSEFTFPATVHALMHNKNGDLTTATAYAKRDILVAANSVLPVHLHFDRITDFKESKATIDATSSPDFVPAQIEVRVGYSRTSHRKVGLVDVNNTKKKFPVFPNHLYVMYRAHVVAADGSTSDSGEKGFNIFGPESLVAMPPAPILIAPPETLKTGTELVATGALGGLYEHVFVPKSGAPGSIHIVSTDVVIPLPSLQKLGASNLNSEHVWTVRAYSEIKVPEFFGGVDGRRWWRFGTSAPRTVRFASEN
jgi:hypothetical protein